MSLDGVREAVQTGVKASAARRQAGATDRSRAAVRQAAAALPQGKQEVLRQLLESMYAAISQEGPRDMGLRGPAVRSPLWQEACLAYLGGCIAEQLSGWRWRVSREEALQPTSAELELVPYLLHGSRAAIRKVHFDRLRAEEDAYEAEFQMDESVDDYGYMDGMSEIAMAALWAFQDSMGLRDRLLPLLLEAAVRGGAAALPLAMARSLDSEREAKWGGAGAAWAEGWEPKPEAHARFAPRFRAAVRALLLANHRGLPGTDHQGKPIHLPAEVLLGIVRGMAAPEAEAAWVTLVGPLPSWIDLNSDM
ncbi:hypothetical protein C2E21_1800 [Chlorella sorokiniana]|uniref:Uncharacterized protein n=1 Tax=Chlorella sorokiniana TaxID=3076 RepID=A0A2P6U0C5_CHLSO|nr:hypothetical protein C2E21_1800 [Chlorella sorokiniana]|eukprot:PRW59763.1 hypothetical protein C2E21_1800 [Chlorella sorokiniana]